MSDAGMSRKYAIWKFLRENGPADSRALQQRFGTPAAQTLWLLRRGGHIEAVGTRTIRGRTYQATARPPGVSGEIGARLFDALDWLHEYGEAMAFEYAKDMGLTRSCARERFRRLRDLGYAEFKSVGKRGFGQRNVGLSEEGIALWERENERRRLAG